MKNIGAFIIGMACMLTVAGAASHADDSGNRAVKAAVFQPDGRLVRPADYREWIYLSSGIDMSYRTDSGMSDHSMFDNVFVDPAAYRAFQQTGTWPDGTTLVMEVRGAASKGSIAKRGKFQTAELMGLEVHVRDSARFKDAGNNAWGFFAFDDDKPAAQIPTTQECYSCHRQHGAVDTTFVQFYPTLFGIATAKGTLSSAYRAETTGAAAKPLP